MALPSMHRRRSADRPTSPSSPPPTRSDDPAADPPGPVGSAEEQSSSARVPAVHRAGAVAVAAVLLVFGLLGFAGGLDFFSTQGERVLGLSSNGLLSALSMVTAVVLVAAALRGARTASTVMIVVGTLFLLSALVNLALLRTSFNFLAFEMPNVFFSIGAGLVLLLLGAYGRVTGNLPADSPYARQRIDVDETEGADEYPSTPVEFAAERAMREAEIAVVQHVASFEQRRRVAAMTQLRSRRERRRAWMRFDARSA